MDVLERFLGNLFTDIQGYLTGDINISGPFDELTVTGKGRLKNAGLKVIFTQCYYDIQDTDIELTNTEIKLDGIILRDKITGNPVYLTGGIEHQSFKNMFYNLDISTRKPKSILESDNKPVQLLLTTLKDNKQFFGNVKGTGSLSLLGPQSNMYMKIDAVASETDSSFITLPPSTGRESGSADFLVERKYGREMDATDLRGSTSIVYDVDITVNKTPVPMVGVRIILDDLTGDEIKGKGYGALNIRSGTSEPLSLRGRFDIEEGSYMFTFQSFFKKPFDLRKGRENYIEWNGDPYDANVRFNAAYTAERVSFAPLKDILPVNSNVAAAREDVFVIATLTDKLFKPVINFSLDFPNTSVAVNDPELALVFQQMQRNLNEINRQVTYLIVFNSFAPAGNTASATSTALNEFAYSTVSSISGLLFNEISQVVNSAFSKIFNSDNIGFNISGSLYNRNLLSQNNGFNPNQGQLDINIPISLFKDRFMVKVGSTLDLALDGGPAVQEALRLLPDVTLEWLINQSGSIRASFFYRENNDYLASTTTGSPGKAKRIGANISYRKDFDSLGDIFRKKKKKKVPEPEPVTENQAPMLEPKKEDE
ncbi:MAG: translocation/assembly module TamB domain-containing protein [Chitinophagaceae bacterium]|nr:translocation/assembly module TamB domain-containing protein [Chitinophagaceae bacterium]